MVGKKHCQIMTQFLKYMKKTTGTLVPIAKLQNTSINIKITIQIHQLFFALLKLLFTCTHSTQKLKFDSVCARVLL